jgi:hypothetical protein
MTSPPKTHPGDSSEQRSAETEILAALAEHLGVHFDGHPEIDLRVRPDGFADGPIPTCVEIWAHQGKAKSAQTAKVMKDMCKLLLVEKLIGKQCRKIVAVCDANCLSFLQNSWQGRFADEFGIERIVVAVDETTRDKVRKAQERQYR